MKRKLLLLAVITICLAIVASGTMAYFTTEDTAINVISTGAVDIEVEEWQQTDEGVIPYPADEPIAVMPGAAVSKIVTVKNLAEDSYVRAKFNITITDENGAEMQLDAQTLASLISVDVNDEAWTRKEGDDEWWYYASALTGEESTEALFTEVVFSGPNMTNEYQGCSIAVSVKAQAVQKAHNGASALEAAGWPEA